MQSCRSVSCTPPLDCKSFLMGSTCCEFICLDEEASSPPFQFSSIFPHLEGNWLIILGAGIATSLILLCCMGRCCYYKYRTVNEQTENAQDVLERDGLVHFNAFLKICDKSGKKLGTGEIGEIYMKFEFGVLRCYNELPEAMRNTMDGEGFYRTGDIGYMKKGIVYILDKNRYISDRRNSNVSGFVERSRMTKRCEVYKFQFCHWCHLRTIYILIFNLLYIHKFLITDSMFSFLKNIKLNFIETDGKVYFSIEASLKEKIRVHVVFIEMKTEIK
jgi:AMP-binding enzyme